jgi:integrase/recombinase XerD
MVSFYAELKTKEITALVRGNVFNEECTMREQFILSAAQSQGGKTRTVYFSQ